MLVYQRVEYVDSEGLGQVEKVPNGELHNAHGFLRAIHSELLGSDGVSPCTSVTRLRPP